ncbi:MAG: hypothetical protein WBX15_12915 [Thermoanaerobaculia bacterium]
MRQQIRGMVTALGLLLFGALAIPAAHAASATAVASARIVARPASYSVGELPNIGISQGDLTRGYVETSTKIEGSLEHNAGWTAGVTFEDSPLQLESSESSPDADGARRLSWRMNLPPSWRSAPPSHAGSDLLLVVIHNF